MGEVVKLITLADRELLKYREIEINGYRSIFKEFMRNNGRQSLPFLADRVVDAYAEHADRLEYAIGMWLRHHSDSELAGRLEVGKRPYRIGDIILKITALNCNDFLEKHLKAGEGLEELATLEALLNDCKDKIAVKLIEAAVPLGDKDFIIDISKCCAFHLNVDVYHRPTKTLTRVILNPTFLQN